MSAFFSAGDRMRIARELLSYATEEQLRDAAAIARALVALEMDVCDILRMGEVRRHPSIRGWLARQLGRAVGVLAQGEAV